MEFHTSAEIELYEFVVIQIPCYVFIRLIGKLRKSENDDIYTFEPATVEQDVAELFLTDEQRKTQRGPADTRPNDVILIENVAGQLSEIICSEDKVQCSHCLQWPTQAADWPTRVRQYNCPDTATIQRAVDGGCDLVFAAHRLCKHDAWLRARMKRISFSRAETTLLNGWTPTQQIAYHLLRYVVKRAGFIEHSADDSANQSEQSMNGVFHNYYMKTIMLWSCEQQSPAWWSLPLVHIITSGSDHHSGACCSQDHSIIVFM